jgi:hypothetical protein
MDRLQPTFYRSIDPSLTTQCCFRADLHLLFCKPSPLFNEFCPYRSKHMYIQILPHATYVRSIPYQLSEPTDPCDPESRNQLTRLAGCVDDRLDEDIIGVRLETLTELRDLIERLRIEVAGGKL